MENEQNILGIVPLDENRELHFLISPYKGRRLAHIREFLKTTKYTGYTKRGIALNDTTLESIINILNGFPSIQNVNHDQEIGRISKNNVTTIIVRLIEQGRTCYLDIREYIETERYEGWTKKGARIPLKAYDEAKVFIRSCHDALIGELDKGGITYIPEQQSSENKLSEIAEKSDYYSLKEILGEEALNFPEDFTELPASELLTRISLPKEPLRLGVSRDGVQYIVNDAEFILELRNEVEAKYVIYAQLRGATSVNVPKNMFIIFKAVKRYEKYVREVRKKLIEFYKKQSYNYLVAKNKARVALQKVGIPWIE